MRFSLSIAMVTLMIGCKNIEPLVYQYKMFEFQKGTLLDYKLQRIRAQLLNDSLFYSYLSIVEHKNKST